MLVRSPLPTVKPKAMLDGSDAISDWPILNAMLNADRRAPPGSPSTMVVGLGLDSASMPDRSSLPTAPPRLQRRLERVLTTDPGMGIVRHADAGYELAIDAARQFGIDMPMLE